MQASRSQSEKQAQVSKRATLSARMSGCVGTRLTWEMLWPAGQSRVASLRLHCVGQAPDHHLSSHSTKILLKPLLDRSQGVSVRLQGGKYYDFIYIQRSCRLAGPQGRAGGSVPGNPLLGICPVFRQQGHG